MLDKENAALKGQLDALKHLEAKFVKINETVLFHRSTSLDHV